MKPAASIWPAADAMSWLVTAGTATAGAGTVVVTRVVAVVVAAVVVSCFPFETWIVTTSPEADCATTMPRACRAGSTIALTS
jgi:hypothetical protein